MKKLVPIFAAVLVFIISVNAIPDAFAESQTGTTSDNSLDIRIDLEDELKPGEETRLKIDFLTPNTDTIQVHIDYTVNITNNDQSIFGPIPLTHTSIGSVSIPVVLEDGANKVTIDVEGILFMPIPKETATFDVVLGQKNTENNPADSSKVPAWIKSNAEWWANDLIDDETFVSGIQFLIRENIITVSSSSSSESTSDEIPKWIKNNADWWSQGLISDNDFLKGIEFLVGNGIISVSSQTTEPEPIKESESEPEPEILNIGGIDLSQASPTLGSADAPVTIVEFGDYQCPKCKQWFSNTKPEIVENYIETGKANLYFVDIAFLGTDSLTAAEATYCAEEEGLYWDFHSHLYSNQRRIDSGWANESSLQNYAELLGLNKDSFVSCLDSGKYENTVLFNMEQAVNNGIQATPSFIIVGPNGEKESILGPQPYAVFDSVIEPMLNS